MIPSCIGFHWDWHYCVLFVQMYSIHCNLDADLIYNFSFSFATKGNKGTFLLQIQPTHASFNHNLLWDENCMKIPNCKLILYVKTLRLAKTIFSLPIHLIKICKIHIISVYLHSPLNNKRCYSASSKATSSSFLSWFQAQLSGSCKYCSGDFSDPRSLFCSFVTASLFLEVPLSR